MTERNLQINGYDSKGPETEEKVASITFVDPHNPDGTYCVGFSFAGGDIYNPNNWTYDHANYWTPETFEEDSVEENPITLDHLDKILEEQGQSVGSLLKTYCDLLNEVK